MKLRTYLFVFIAAFAGSFFMASCLNEENRIPPNCYDGELNNGEVNIDCGGLNCPECDHCTNGVFEPERGETWRDCGGECPVCQPCSNGIMDGDEQAIDCGGSCGGCDQLCEDGLLNGFEDDIDCENQTDLVQGGCEFCPTCIDGVMNGSETGIDCGGPDCEACCSTGNCRNSIQDATEFYVDCGGTTCHDCPDTLVWKIGSTVYFTPSQIIVVSDAGGTLTYSDNEAYELDEDAPPIALGTLSLLITQPDLGWPASLSSPINFPEVFDPTEYVITWTDDAGIVYSSSNLDGLGKFTMVRAGTVVVPDDDFDGCHKPAGTYVFYRGTFSGTLFSNDPELPSVNCSQGLFQITFFIP